MKLIDGDALMEEFLHRVKTDPDLCWDDVEWLINDAEELEEYEEVYDLVRRRSAIFAVRNAVTKEVAEQEIRQLPGLYFKPAVVERKRGKWIRHSIGHENTPWGFDCSACGKWFVIGEDTAEQYNYCPNCGAEMKQ